MKIKNCFEVIEFQSQTCSYLVSYQSNIGMWAPNQNDKLWGVWALGLAQLVFPSLSPG